MLLAAAAGLVLKNNLDRIGPLALAALVGAAALACYVFAWIRRDGASVIDDYVLLLAALLVSADIAFIETQFRLFGAQWYRQFLVAGALHAAAAYLFRSRTLLSLSIVAVAAWIGVRESAAFDLEPREFSLRLLACLCVVAAWRVINRRDEFTAVFEQFGVHFLLLSALVLTGDDKLRLAVACPLTIVFAGGVVAWGLRGRRESFVVAGFLYALIAIAVALFDLFTNEELVMALIVITIAAAIGGLFAIHAHFRELRA